MANTHAPRTADWLNAEVAAWLEAAWKAGVSLQEIADGIVERTGALVKPDTVNSVCYHRWGARLARKSGHKRAADPGEPRVRQCMRCRGVFTLPRFVFRCAPCRNSRDNGDDGAYRIAGRRAA